MTSVYIDLAIFIRFIGVSRTERWDRAENLGLNPDPKIMQIIQQHPDDPLYTEW